MRSSWILLFCFFIYFNPVKSQSYDEAIGFRVGPRAGLLYKNYKDYETSVQSLISFQYGGVQINIIKQFHNPVKLEGTNKIFFYYGFGGHLGYSKWSREEYVVNGEKYQKKEFSANAGIDANFGLEYKAYKIPLVVAIDYQPYFQINVPFSFIRNYYDIALVITYRF